MTVSEFLSEEKKRKNVDNGEESSLSLENSVKKPKVAVTSTSNSNHDGVKKIASTQKPLPITLLGGFLGAGKTSLLKHVLEMKQKQDDSSENNGFKCAVIVNDVSELNIDKSLIDQSSLVQSEEVIAMQNGCVCCTLQNDLVDQIAKLANKDTFDYMIIEASGIAEPSEVAKLFQECTEDHDHEEEHQKDENKIVLSDVARLDTCVTVVDAAQFFDNFETVARQTNENSNKEPFSKLMVEQIEYCNVLVLNKIDLVSKDQLETIENHLKLLNGHAKIITAHQGIINVSQVINTHLYNADDFRSISPILLEQEVEKDCCTKAASKGESPCCSSRKKFSQTLKSGLSTVLLSSNNKSSPKMRHDVRFGITSFVYQSRRPFHSTRFQQDFIAKHFVFVEDEADEEDDDDEDDGIEVIDTYEPEDERNSSSIESAPDNIAKIDDTKEKLHPEVKESSMETDEKTAGSKKGTDAELDKEEYAAEEAYADKKEKEYKEQLKQQQEEAIQKKQFRTEKFGTILRSKGFIWTAHTHDIMVSHGQAGNIVTMDLEEKWNVLDPKAWIGSDAETAPFRKGFVEPYGDRRQELVFIGLNMKHDIIQKELDACLLTDDEFKIGIDGWKATIGDIFL